VISADSARRVDRRLAEKLSIATTRTAIADVPVDRSLQSQAELAADLATDPDPERWGPKVAVSMMPWQPVIHGNIIPASPTDRIVAGAGAEIDLMVGATTEEWRLFLAPSGPIEYITAEILAGALAAYGPPPEGKLVLVSGTGGRGKTDVRR